MYSIHKIGKCDNSQLAFAVDYDNSNILICNSGHGKILQSYPDATHGGWIFRKKGKISESGYLSKINKDREMIIDILTQLFCY